MHLSVPVDVQELPGEEDKLMEDKLEQRDESNPVSDSKLVGSVAVQQRQRSVLRHPIPLHHRTTQEKSTHAGGIASNCCLESQCNTCSYF
jgi:hypothetical protein